jgi:hypothetical protein
VVARIDPTAEVTLASGNTGKNRHATTMYQRDSGIQQMKYVLKGRVAMMDAAYKVFQAGAVYIDGQIIAAAQDSAAPAPPGFADAAIVSSSQSPQL